ncbi:unnamed protein product [Protopolystoma xenopodis]|uniref:Uncharacterized protein n=1 Tax=Protopolystoma xenopodis TaxID=117903 RepID=A0A3S5ABN4_9PLAT|nr:unnamed protein product [Protopolystoma xenopodis]
MHASIFAGSIGYILDISAIPPLPLYVLLAVDSLKASDLAVRPGGQDTGEAEPSGNDTSGSQGGECILDIWNSIDLKAGGARSREHSISGIG